MGIYNHWPYTNVHELNLDWVVKTIKELSQEWATYHAEWDTWQGDINQAISDFRDYMNNYFDNLDVQNEINNKLDEMERDGSLYNLIAPLVPNIITDWLDTHITPTSPAIDSSLLVAEAGADSKITGNNVFALENQLYYDSKNYKLPFNLFFEPGNVTIYADGRWIYDETLKDYRARVREGVTLQLHAGDIIRITDTTLIDCYLGWRNDDGTSGQRGWSTEDYIVPKNGKYCILIRSLTAGGFTNVNDIATKLVIVPAEQNYIAGNLITWDQLELGYMNSANGTDNDAFGNTTHEMRSQFFDIEMGDSYTLYYNVTVPTGGRAWMTAIYYDENKQMLGRYNIVQSDAGYVGEFTFKENIVVPSVYASPVKYIRVTARLYDDGVLGLYYGSPDRIEIPNWWEEITNNHHMLDIYDVKSIAHSGYAYGTDGAPEDTLPAYILAKQNGFSIVETDVRHTEDGIPVLLHDSTIDRTSDGTGSVYDYTWAQLQQYDFGSWKGEQWTGTKIPSLREFMALCRELKLYPYLELEAPMDKEMVETIVNIVKEYGMEEQVTFISFEFRLLQYARLYSKIIRLGMIFDLTSGVTSWEIVYNRLKFLRTSKNQVFIDSRVHLLDTNDNSYISAGIDTLAKNNMPCEVWLIVNDTARFNTVNPIVSGFTTSYKIYEDFMKEKYNIT